MKFSDLRYIYSLKKTKSFTETAKVFMVSQPVVSLAIQRLEKELNKKIIVREKFKGAIELTDTGQALVEYFEKIDVEFIKLKKKFEFKNNKFIHVGCNNPEINIILKNFLPKIYEIYEKDGKELVIFNEEEKILRKNLLEKNIKFKLSIFEEIQKEECFDFIRKKILKVLKFSIIKTEKYKKVINNLNDLNFCTVVALKNSFQTKKMNEIFDENNINPKQIIYVNNMNLAKILIEQGRGVGIFIDDFFENYENFEKIDIHKNIYLYLEYLINQEDYNITKLFNF